MTDKDKRWQGTTHPLKDLETTRETKRMHKREERMGSVARGKVRTHEETELDETINIQQRQKRASIMRRYKSKIERGREVAKSRVASQGNIKKRAYAQARQIFRKKLAGEHGAEYEKLGPSEKMAVDKLLDNKGKSIKKLALRLLPKVKRNEYQRLQSYTKGQALMNHGVSEEFNDLFLEYFGSNPPGNSGSTGERSMNPISSKDTKSKKTKAPQIKILGKFNEEYENDTAISRALENKADKTGIDLAIIGEVYDRGLEAWSEQYNVSPTQYAFARVNSFINKGKTYYNEDADLVEETIDEKRGLWDNIHAKRKRIKAGSGERMRKPGSKGAPSAADLKAAQESVEVFEQKEVELHDGGPSRNIKKATLLGPDKTQADHVIIQTSNYLGKPTKIAIHKSWIKENLDEAGSKYNIPMARSKPKTSTGRTFGSVLDEVDVPVKHLDRARSVWNRTKDVEAVKKFVSGVKEEVELDESYKVMKSSSSMGAGAKMHSSGHASEVEARKSLGLSDVRHKVRGLPRSHPKTYYGDDGHYYHIIKNNTTNEAVDPEFIKRHMDTIKKYGGDMHHTTHSHKGEHGSGYVTGNDPHKEGHVLLTVNTAQGIKTRSNNPTKEISVHGKNLTSDWKKSYMVSEAKDPDRNSKLRQGMQYVERDITPETPDSDAVPPTSPCSDAAKQQRIKKRIIEQKTVEVDPAKRFIGTDSLVKVYKKATPGQSLDESFTMAFDYQGKPTLAPTASELHMQAKGGFAHHTDVQNVMEVTDIKNKIQAMFETTILEEDKDQLAISYNDLSDMVQEAFDIIEKIKTSTVERDAWSEAQILKMERYIESVNAYLDNMYEDVESGLKSPVVVPAHNDQYGNPIPAKTVLRKTGKKIIKSDQAN